MAPLYGIEFLKWFERSADLLFHGAGSSTLLSCLD